MAQTVIIDKCELCETEDNVDFFCVSCEEILCSNCKLLHSKNRKTKNDKVIPLSQARDDDLVHKATVVYCSEHSTVEVTIFCFKCDKLICTQCLIEKHNGHKISTLDKIRDSKTEELKKVIKTLQERKVDSENVFQAEGQAHSQFLQSIDRAEKDIFNQKAKIIEELTIVCDEQFSQLSKLRKDEEKRYTDVCNKFQSRNQAVTSILQTAKHSIATRNTALIIHATVDATKAYNELEELTIPQAKIAAFYPGDRSRPTICHVQGNVNIEQKTIASHQTGDKTHPTTPQVQGKTNIEQGAKPKLTDVHKVKVQEEKTSGDNKQHKYEDSKLRIDVRKVIVKSGVEIKGKDRIYVIVPLENKTAWVQCDDDKYLTLINSAGKTITKSVLLDSEIYDAKQYRNRLLVTCCDQCKIYSLSLKGKSTPTFSDLSPYKTQGLCVTHDLEVIVCLYKSSKDNKVVRLNTAGNVIQTIQHDVTGAPLYNDPRRLTSLTTGKVIVIDDFMRIIGASREGQHLFTWEGELHREKLASYMYLLQSITHDSNNNLFVTEYHKHRVYVLREDGSGAMCLLDSTQGVDRPWAIAVDNTGQLWVGCRVGKILVIEY